MRICAGSPSSISRRARRFSSKVRLQTRKWQDQSGQDRYSTEVVLQGFRGELTLLDRAGGGGAAGGGSDADEAGEFGSPGPTRKVAAAAAAGGGRGGDMDDEIPF